MTTVLGDYRHFGDLLTRNARLNGDAEGLVMGDLRLSWRQADARANALAHALARRGVAQGDRVALLAENSVGYVEAFFALARAGLVAVPINGRLTADEAARVLQDCEATALLTDDSHLATARDAAGQVPSIRLLASLEAEQGDVIGHDRLLAEGNTASFEPRQPIGPDDLLVLLYTSGTTGFPKGVMYSHRRALLGTVVHVLAIGSHRRHRVMLPSPLYSAAGFAGIACAVAVGSPCHILRFTVESALETIARERITFTNLVPTTVRMLLDHPARGQHDLSSLEVLLYGGSPMPKDTLRDASQVLDCGFRQTFATSETGLAGTVLEPADHRAALADPTRAHLLASCGKPQVGVGVRILGDDGHEVPRGEIGEIAVATDANMIGYWNRPEATAAVLHDGWLRTGDVARQDPEGFFYLIDRKHDMIVTGALNVFPSEVERVLRTHEAVADCAVVGLPDSKWGEAVTAFVVPHDGCALDEKAILAHCRGQLAGFKRPKSVRPIDAIPRNPAGKPLRRLLRQDAVRAH